MPVIATATKLGYILAFAFVVAFILQALLAVGLEHKRIKAPVKELMPAIILFPFFMIIYAIAITLGVFSKPKWSQVKRNVTVSSALAADVNADARSEAAAADGELRGGDALHTHSDNGENRAERAETDQDEYDGSCGNASDGKNKGEQ